MQKPKLFGADYSVYVRAARLALHEKGVPYDLVPVDVFAEGGPPPWYGEKQPFGKIPAFEHGGFGLHETGAVTRYVDEAFDGPPLQPVEPRRRARMNQIVGIADAYVYPHLVWGLYVETVSKPRRGDSPDKERVASARAVAPVCLRALSGLMGAGPWLAGDALTLADIHLAPMFHYVMLVPEARTLLESHPGLAAWWRRMAERPSMLATRPAVGEGG